MPETSRPPLDGLSIFSLIALLAVSVIKLVADVTAGAWATRFHSRLEPRVERP